MDQDTTGTEVGDIALDGDTAPPTERGKAAPPPPTSAHVCCGQTVPHLSNCHVGVEMCNWQTDKQTGLSQCFMSLPGAR